MSVKSGKFEAAYNKKMGKTLFLNMPAATGPNKLPLCH